MTETAAPTLDHDPLLLCLVALTHWFERPQTAVALTAGLPFTAEGLTPDLFRRAAHRVGLQAQLVRRPLSQLKSLHLPAVLLLADGQACIFLRRLTRQRGVILVPETGQQREIELKELQADYTGQALLIQAEYHFDRRSDSGLSTLNRHWFWSPVGSAWALYGEVLIASLLINLFALATPLFIMNVYDRVVPNQALDTLWVLAIGVVIILGFDLIMRLLRGYFIDMAGKRIELQLSSHVFAHLLGTPRSVHPRSVGAMANHLHEFEGFREFLTSATLTTVIDLPFAFLFIAVIAFIHPELAHIALIAIPVILILSLLLQIPLRHAIQYTFRAGAHKQALLVEALSSLETLKTQHAEGAWQQRWESITATAARYSVKVRLLSNFTVHFALFVQQLVTVSIVIAGVYLIGQGALTVGGLIAATLLSGRAIAPLAQVAGLLTRYHQSRSALQAVAQVMQLPQERPPGQQYLQRGRFSGAIQLRQVDFQYPEQARPALSNVSFAIAAGERVGILGRTGCGKSTLARLLLGLYPLNEGQLLFDGVDSQQLDPADRRQNIGYMPQDGSLFYGSVRDNIGLGDPQVSDAQVLQAAELAGVTQFVNQHPQGFDWLIGERGEGLSSGQRQAILLARALLYQPPILVLDEPTAALDNGSEEALKQRLAPFLTDRTLLLITHRPSLLSLVDRLIVLDAGQVVASGPTDHVINALQQGQVRGH